jgi:hypothetical protein
MDNTLLTTNNVMHGAPQDINANDDSAALITGDKDSFNIGTSEKVSE